MEQGDLIGRSHFRRTPDGTTVFFPWRLTGRGYVVADEGRRRRIERVLTRLYVAMIVLGSLGYGYASYGRSADAIDFAEFLRTLAWAIGPALLPVLFYWLWVAREVEHLPPSDLRISPEQAQAEAARRVSPAEARRGMLAGFALLLASLFVAWMDPARLWWLAALGAAIAGLVARSGRPRRPEQRQHASGGVSGRERGRKRCRAPALGPGGR